MTFDDRDHSDITYIWNEFSAKLKAFISRRVKEENDAEDILQDVFVKIHSSIDSLRSREKLGGWIYRIARNAIIDHYRRKKDAVESIDEGGDTLAYRFPENGESNINKEAEAFVLVFIDLLPPHYRDALMRTEIEGLTQRELAEKLGISVSGAKSRVQRARQLLKKNMLQCCDFMHDSYGNVLEYRVRSAGKCGCDYCKDQ